MGCNTDNRGVGPGIILNFETAVPYGGTVVFLFVSFILSLIALAIFL